MGRKNLLLAVNLLFTFVLWLATQSGHSQQMQAGQADQGGAQFAQTRLIVKLKAEVDRAITPGKSHGSVTTGLVHLDSLALKFRVSKREKLFAKFEQAVSTSEALSGAYVLEVPHGTDLHQMKMEYESRPEVEYAELDYELTLFDEPDDPLFRHQWYLNNLGLAQNDSQGYYGNDRAQGHQLVMKFGSQDADMDALEAFERDDEKIIPLVGILDTGVDIDHEDLRDNIWANRGEIPGNGIDDDHNGFVDDLHGWDFSGDSAAIQEDNDPTDTHGHGTHCAGIVAAVSGNGVGIAGINTPCNIVAVKLFPHAFMSLSARGIVYAAELGCDVINMSWGSAHPSKLIKDALDYAIDMGVLPVAAAGNDSTEKLNYPAAYEGVLTVGASNSHDEVTRFSTYGEHLDVVAPGEDILSLRAEGTDMYSEDGFPDRHIVDERYYLANGTSMAAPCAAGVAAYILAASPGISVTRVKEMITQSADDVVYPYGGDSLYSPGKDVYSGHGRVNLNSALELLSGMMARIDYPTENALVSGSVAVMGTASGPNFSGYVLEYGEGLWPDDWTQIASSIQPVTRDTLGVWNSGGLVGLFTLRLRVGEQNRASVHVIAGNDTYVKITSPAQGDTVSGFVAIQGYTVAPGFQRYTLEYGYGESPAYWIPMTSSTKMVADGLLANWLVSFLNVTDYSIRLYVETNTGEAHADTVGIVVRSIASEGWTREFSTNGSLCPGVADVDADGYDEVVVGLGSSAQAGGRGGVEVFSHDGRREPGWPKDTDKNMMSSPALGDIDQDGITDIVICSSRGVHAYLSASPDWSQPASTEASAFWGLATPVIADLENDDHPELFTIGATGQVYAWRGDGESVIPGANGAFGKAAGSTKDMDVPCLAVADLDGDGQNEVIAGTAHPISGEFGDYQGVGGIYIWDAQGNPVLEPEDYPDEFVHVFGIAVANVDENQDLEVLALASDGRCHSICAMKKDGTQPSGYPVVMEDLIAGWWFGNHPAIGDMDGDGTLEIVVSLWTVGEARIYAWHQDGTPVGPQSPLVSLSAPRAEENRQALSSLGSSIGEIATRTRAMSQEELVSLGVSQAEGPFATEAGTFGSPVLADVNGDGQVDILARAGHFLSSGYERLYAWDHGGSVIPGFPLYASAEANMATYYPYTPLAGDFDKDGKFNLLLNTDFNAYSSPRIICWEFDVDSDPGLEPWPRYMHDRWNSGRYGFEPPAEAVFNLPPVGFHVKSWTASSVTLGWSPKAPWTSLGYNIYRSTVSGGPGEKLNPELIPQPDSQYQDEGLNAEQVYYYTIANVNHDLVESNRSPEIKITPGGPSAPAQPLAEVEHRVVRLSWPPNPEEQGIEEYLVYHKTPSCSDFYLLGSAASGTTYVDSSLKETGIHQYRISAVSLMGLESLPSEAVGADIQEIGSPPYRLKVASWLAGNVTLSWKVVQGGDGCYVYRSAVPGVYSDPPVNAAPIDDPVGWEISCRDSLLTEGVTYHYVITQVRGGAETSPSNRADFLAGRPQAVVTVSGEVRDCHVVVHWNPSGEGDVVEYRIYDGMGHEGDIALVDSVQNDTIYVDPATDDSLKHYFWVTAVDSFGLESYLPFNLEAEPARVTGPLYPPEPPAEFKITDHTDTSVTFKFSSIYAHAFNIYRSSVSGQYYEPPVNPAPILNVFPQQYVFYFTDMIEGQSYFFNVTATTENECGVAESRREPSLEAVFVPGRPKLVAGLSAELNQECHMVLNWEPNQEGDIVKYRIYRWQAVFESGFLLIDSVFVPQTTYVDTSLALGEGYRYGVAAVDSLGLEGLMQKTAWIGVVAPTMPDWLQVTDITDTSVTLEWQKLSWDERVAGSNVYRSLVSGHYLGLDPINDSLISYDNWDLATYTDFEVQEGMTYYYTVTNVNACGMESPLYRYSDPPYDSLEDTALAGMPHPPDLKVRSGRESIRLHISTSDTDIKGYAILRSSDGGDFQIIESLCRDTMYTDFTAAGEIDYRYQVIAIDTLNLESEPSKAVEGCLMLFDRGIGLVDLTRGTDSFQGVNGDSVDAFYRRALEGYDYVYRDRSQGTLLRLIDLSHHPVAIVHQEDESSVFYTGYYPLLQQYLEAGGALLIEGRRILVSYDELWFTELQRFPTGDFRRECLNIDSAFVPEYWNAITRIEEFVGAERAPGMTSYPEIVELDTFRVNHSYDPAEYDLQGRLPGVGYCWPSDPSEVMYTFNSDYDTSASNGKPVALRHFRRDLAVIYFGFPLYFVREDVATQILHTALDELLKFAGRSTPYYGSAEDLNAASVYPNPFKPYRGHTHVTFDGLTARAKIEIFTIAGEKVRTIEETDGDGETRWDVTNEEGRNLASGVYVYRISNDQGEEKISKLAVIR